MNIARKKGITDKQRRFVEEYFVDYNQTAAAIRAGYSPRSAGVIAAELMANPAIQELIELRRAQLSSRLNYSVQRIQDRLACMGFANIRNLVDIKDGEVKIKNMDDISEYDSAAIQEISISKTKNGTTTKIKLVDAKGPLELLGKSVGMFKDKVEITGAGDGPIQVVNTLDPTAVEDRINELIAKREAGT
jgi:phage terminase small subunit